MLQFLDLLIGAVNATAVVLVEPQDKYFTRVIQDCENVAFI